MGVEREISGGHEERIVSQTYDRERFIAVAMGLINVKWTGYFVRPMFRILRVRREDWSIHDLLLCNADRSLSW
jgi:hypothetical protein